MFRRSHASRLETKTPIGLKIQSSQMFNVQYNPVSEFRTSELAAFKLFIFAASFERLDKSYVQKHIYTQILKYIWRHHNT